MASPRVSIPVPVFNGARTIGAAIESALAQTYEDFEVIVVDNASTDATCEIVEAFGDPRIRLVHQPRNLGFLANHNRSTAESIGEFIKPLHADDRLLPTCVEAMLEVFDRHPDVGLVFAPRQIELEDPEDPEEQEWREQFGNPHLKFRGLQEANSGPELLRQFLAARVAENWVGEPSAVMLRRTVIERIGLYSPNIMAMNDMDMNLRAMALFDIGYVDSPQSVYVRSRGSLVNSLNTKDWLDRVWMLQGLAEDAEMRQRIPEAVPALSAERRQTARVLVRTARRRPRLLPTRLRQVGRYVGHLIKRALGRRPPLHPSWGPGRPSGPGSS